MVSDIVSVGLLVVIPALIARAIWERTRTPLQPMTNPSAMPFLPRYARQAAREHRLMWIKYREPTGQVIESTVEIYHTTWSGHIRGWCHPQRCRRTFRKDSILSWQLLNEQFKRSDGMERWSRWEGWFEWMRELRGMARGY
jgi:predicted DNA-binding transcriptional regulator YafY